MKKKILLLILFFSILQLAFSQFTKSYMFLEILDYGLVSCDSSKMDSVEIHPNFNHGLVYNAIVDKKTDTIEAKIGNRFGVIYVLKDYSHSIQQIRIEWEFPEEVKGVKTLSYYVTSKIFSKTFSLYTFEDKEELVKGKWQLRMYNKNKLLLIKDFVVI